MIYLLLLLAALTLACGGPSFDQGATAAASGAAGGKASCGRLCGPGIDAGGLEDAGSSGAAGAGGQAGEQAGGHAGASGGSGPSAGAAGSQAGSGGAGGAAGQLAAGKSAEGGAAGAGGEPAAGAPQAGAGGEPAAGAAGAPVCAPLGHGPLFLLKGAPAAEQPGDACNHPFAWAVGDPSSPGALPVSLGDGGLAAPFPGWEKGASCTNQLTCSCPGLAPSGCHWSSICWFQQPGPAALLTSGKVYLFFEVDVGPGGVHGTVKESIEGAGEADCSALYDVASEP